MTPAELAAIRERADAATEGPWEAEHRESLDWLSQGLGDDSHQPGSTVHNGDPGNPLFGTLWPNRNGRENAEFIAHARSDIPALLDHVEVQASVIEALNAGVNSALSAKIHAVRELHTSVKPDSDGEHYLDPLTRKPKCGECLLIYPCPTIQAIEGDQ